MSLKTIVKVSHISNLSDARYCAGMGVDMLGVGVIPSQENYLSPAIFHEIRGWIAGPKIIAELYGLSSLEEVEAAIETYAPDYLELAVEEYLKFGPALPLPCLINCGATPPHPIPGTPEKISHLIADERMSCADVPAQIPVLIRVSSLQSLSDKLAKGCFSGVVLEAPKQSRAGMTSYEQLGHLLEALEDA